MFKKWRPKNSFEATWPIRMITWIFGLGIIHYPLNNSRIELTIVYTISVISGYIISLYCVSHMFANIRLIPVQLTLLWIIIFVNMMIYFSGIILTWYWRNQSKSIELRAKEIDETLEKLGVAMDYPSIFVQSLRVVIFWSILALTINGVNLWHISSDFDTMTAVILVAVFHHLVHANNVPPMHFWMSITLMEQRFKKINEVLLDIVDGEMNGHRMNKNGKWPPTVISVAIRDKSLHRLSTDQNNTKEILRIVKRVHLESSLLCQEILQIFGIQMTMALVSSFITATVFLFAFYVVQFGSNLPTSEKFRRFLLLAVRLVNICMKVFFMNNCCARTTIEWGKTGEIIHELETISNNFVYHDEIRRFSLQMTQNPVSFTACGFVTLGYKYLRSFVGSITTYIVILVQLYGPPS